MHSAKKYGYSSFLTLALLLGLLGTWVLWGPSASLTNYSRLLEFIVLEDLDAPLYAFNDFAEGFDLESLTASMGYFEEHQGLLGKIREDLPGEFVRFRLDGFSHRLMFVPERRGEYSSLFETYCQDIIDEVLERVRLRNPLSRIETPLVARPDVSGSEGGVSAFLVHNLAKQYVAEYVFSGADSKQVRVELKGQVFVGEVGSFTTTLSLGEEGALDFERSPYTIWQNTARNPYTALIVPAEETLHVALRDYTIRAIKAELDAQPMKNVEELGRIAEEWIAVEEAIVGGVVHALLPGILRRYLPGLIPPAFVARDIEEKSRLDKYRYLRPAVSLARQMGPERMMTIFMEAPAQFREFLCRHPEKPVLPLG